jgi:hypothetical protein
MARISEAARPPDLSPLSARPASLKPRSTGLFQTRNRSAVERRLPREASSSHFAKKILKRLYEAGVAQHNARVDFYHFLLAQRTEHNPDYRGGPTFDNARDLIADLHKHVR